MSKVSKNEMHVEGNLKKSTVPEWMRGWANTATGACCDTITIIIFFILVFFEFGLMVNWANVTFIFLTGNRLLSFLAAAIPLNNGSGPFIGLHNNKPWTANFYTQVVFNKPVPSQCESQIYIQFVEKPDIERTV